MARKNFVLGVLCLVVSQLMTGCAKDFGLLGTTTIRLHIDSIAPVSGSVGQAVLIYGQGFSARAGENKVYFNGAAAKIDSNASYNVLLAYAPSGGKTGPVSVTAGGDSAVGPVFTYMIIRVATPVISNVVYNGLFAVTGSSFHATQSVVSIGGQETSGFTYSGSGSAQTLTKQSYTPPANLDNPAPVIVSVPGAASAPYSYLFSPVITGFSVDTAHGNRNLSIYGTLFGSRSTPSTLRAYYYDANQRKTYFSPDPTVVSWNTNTIVATLPNWNGYATYAVVSLIYLEVNVGAKSGFRQEHYYPF